MAFNRGIYNTKSKYKEINYFFENKLLDSEFLVKLACEDGRFGPDCNYTCGMCANGEICDVERGYCPSVCEIGYHGFECLEGVYTQAWHFCLYVSLYCLLLF